jgi:predicted nucleic acid-binding protein
MNKSTKVFLVDSNVLIDPFKPFKKYYPFDFGTSFWDFLTSNIKSGNIVLLSKVYNEITDIPKKGDALNTWIIGLKSKVVSHKTQEILFEYKNVIQYLQTSQILYNPRALRAWSGPVAADAWLVATAKAFGYELVTFEEPDKELGRKISRNPRIPDVAHHFGINCIDLFQMMRLFNFKFQ